MIRVKGNLSIRFRHVGLGAIDERVPHIHGNGFCLPSLDAGLHQFPTGVSAYIQQTTTALNASFFFRSIKNLSSFQVIADFLSPQGRKWTASPCARDTSCSENGLNMGHYLTNTQILVRCSEKEGEPGWTIKR
jgi:hypothetical protein